jgi:putative intracellular protease/amidase
MILAGISVDFVSPLGGLTPIDPVSLQTGVTPVDWKYYADAEFRSKLANTHRPEQINPKDYQAIYYAGGHGVVFDFLDNERLQQISK